MNRATKINIWIISAFVAAAAIATATWFLLRTKTKKAMSYKTIKSGSLIITIPEGDGKKFDMLTVFGGMYYATPQWMKDQMPEDYMLKGIVVFAPHTTTYKKVRAAVDPLLQQEGVEFTSESIAGFSAGGKPTLNAYSKDLRFVGLIDPSFTPAVDLKKQFHSNVAMMWGSPAMIGLFTKDGYDTLQSAIKKAGGNSEQITMDHKKFPAIFFERYKSMI